MSNIFKIKPIKKETWGGHIRYKNTKDTITPYYDKSGLIYTGLTKEQEETLGKDLRADLNRNSSFWHDYKVFMTDKEKEFDLDQPEGKLAYYFLSNHYRVAKSEDTITPYSDYVIFDENKQAEVANKKSLLKRKAIKLFDSLNIAQMKDILKLYPGYQRAETLSNDIVEARLFEKVESDPNQFIMLAEDKTLDTKVFIKDLTQAGILRKNKNTYYYGEDVLGHDLNATVDHIDNPENQGLKVALKKQLEELSK